MEIAGHIRMSAVAAARIRKRADQVRNSPPAVQAVLAAPEAHTRMWVERMHSSLLKMQVLLAVFAAHSCRTRGE